MALDYTMMRDAVNMDAMNRLSRAQAIGESAGALGFLGANAINEQGGLMQMFNNAKYKMNKPKYDAMYQQGLEDNPYLQGDETDNFWNEVNAMSTSKDGTNVTGGQALIDSLNNKKTVTNMKYDAGVRDMVPVTETVTTPIKGTPIPEAMDEIYAPEQVISPEPTGDMVGGSYNMLPDGSFEFMPADDSSITMYQPGQQPGANTPINTAMLNELGNVDQFGMTDEDYLNQNLDMFWNTNASGTPMPGDFPVDSTQKQSNPILNALNFFRR